MTNGKLPEGVREKAMELRQKQQKLAGLVQQKQSLEGRLTETKNALKEVEEAEEGEELYQITGTIMVKKDKEDLKEGLEDKKDLLTLRIDRLEENIKKLKKDTKKMRKELSDQVKGSGLSG